mmetsp:Transcript_20447/g.26121  ORF Transcript_20447/g.26121 Transcript_20447/m.26121 type:complete len:86 (+) Transcript_20447:1567-1824(+)
MCSVSQLPWSSYFTKDMKTSYGVVLGKSNRLFFSCKRVVLFSKQVAFRFSATLCDVDGIGLHIYSLYIASIIFTVFGFNESHVGR